MPAFLLLKVPIERWFFENLWVEKPQKLNLKKSKIKIEVFGKRMEPLFPIRLRHLQSIAKKMSVFKGRSIHFHWIKKD